MKINKHEIWKALTQLTWRCLKYIKGMSDPDAVWHSYFLIPWLSFYEKRAKSLEKIFSSYRNVIWSILLKYQEYADENCNIMQSRSFEWY